MFSQQTRVASAEGQAAETAIKRTKPTRRAAALLAGLAVTVSATACVTATDFRADTVSYPVTLATQVFLMGGLGWEDMPTDVMQSVLGGEWGPANIPVENLHGLSWPASLEPSLNESVIAGVQSVNDAVFITNPDGTLTLRYPGEMNVVGGASGGTLVMNEAMKALEQRREAGEPVPSRAELSFIVLGDGNRGMFAHIPGVKLPLLEYTVLDLPVTPWDVTVVTGEYDGLGNWPDRWWNLLADFNALCGTSLFQQTLPQPIVDALHLELYGSVHREAMDADLSLVPEKNITVSTNELGGVTTTYLVPTPDLPMLRPLKGFGVPQPVIDALTKVLKPIIDSAYVRNDPVNPKPAPGHVRTATTQPVAAKSAAANKELTVSPSAATSAKPAKPARAAKAAAAKAGAKHSASSASAGR